MRPEIISFVFKCNPRNIVSFRFIFALRHIFILVIRVLGGSYWNNFTCCALAQSQEQRWGIRMLLRDTQKGPLISQRPFALIRFFLLLTLRSKTAQEKLDTICQNLPKSSATSAEAKEG